MSKHKSMQNGVFVAPNTVNSPSHPDVWATVELGLQCEVKPWMLEQKQFGCGAHNHHCWSCGATCLQLIPTSWVSSCCIRNQRNSSVTWILVLSSVIWLEMLCLGLSLKFPKLDSHLQCRCVQGGALLVTVFFSLWCDMWNDSFSFVH